MPEVFLHIFVFPIYKSFLQGTPSFLTGGAEGVGAACLVTQPLGAQTLPSFLGGCAGRELGHLPRDSISAETLLFLPALR